MLRVLPLLIALVLVATLFAGGPNPVGEMFTHLIALVLLVVLAWRERERLARFPKMGWALIAAILVLPLLQLIPGGALLAGGAAREALAADLLIAGVERSTWAPLSLNPATSEGFMWSLLPPVAVCLAVWTLAQRPLEVLVWVLLGLALLQVLLGGLQIASEPDGPAFFIQSWYPTFNANRAVGSFANVNHSGSFILMLLPLAWAMSLNAWQRKRFDAEAQLSDAMALPLLSVLIVLLLAGLILTRSRAVMVLAMVTMAMALVWTLPRTRGRSGSRWVMLVTAVGVLVAIELGLYAALSRFEKDPMADLRWRIVEIGGDAITAWWPWGSGFGTFVDAFAAYLPLEQVRTRYINHAHNDYVELLLEAGLPGAVVALGFISALIYLVVRVLRHPGGAVTIPLLALAAAVGMLTVLLHSMVDYPLRTGGVAVAFGVLVGILLRGAYHPSPDSTCSSTFQK